MEMIVHPVVGRIVQTGRIIEFAPVACGAAAGCTRSATYKMLFMKVTPHGSVELAHSELFFFRYLIFSRPECDLNAFIFRVAGNPRPSGQSNAREPTRGN